MHNFLPPNNIQVRTTVTPGIPKAIEWLEYSAPELGVRGSNPGTSVYFPTMTNSRKVQAAVYAPYPMDPRFMRLLKPIFLYADHPQRR